MIGKYFLVGLSHFAVTASVLKILNFILPCCITSYYSYTANILLFLVLSTFTYTYTRKLYLNDRIQPENKAVLVTGCDSGFGHLLVKRLDARGFHVFASCLFPSGPGADELRKLCSKRLHVLELDVRKDESIKASVDFIKANLGTSELWAIVNNAGIHKGVTAELTPLDEFKECLDVNALGPVRVTKAFLPLLRQSKGRVVNLTSLCGRVSIPHLVPYTMSKFAFVGFSECLKQEMDVWGVRVISVEPEMFATPILNKEGVVKRIDESFRTMNEDVRADYGEKYISDFKKFVEYNIRAASPNRSVVIDALESAIALKYPDDFYFPCRNIPIHILLSWCKSIPKPVADCISKIYLYIFGFPTPKAAK